jgi:alkanesulfonate monooxygenase SsuD/methylene tetrahydromethanopterin reductase-like flavin-dependent oxidoreductase (luciferase family)
VRLAVDDAAREAGRDPAALRHQLTVWAGFGRDRPQGERRVAAVMEAAYDLPFERFARYVPCGTPEDVATALGPYVEAGCRQLNLVPEGESLEACIEAVGAVRELLHQRNESESSIDAVTSPGA